MAKDIIDLTSNYRYYIVGSETVHEIEKERLLNALRACWDIIKAPYLRFMNVSDCSGAYCIVYNGNERVTKLIPFSEVEKMIEEGTFHK